MISKKWLYGSLAVVALILGLYLDNSAVAAENNSAINNVATVKIDKQNGDIELVTASKNDSFDNANSVDNDDDNNEDYDTDVDNFVEDDMED